MGADRVANEQTEEGITAPATPATSAQPNYGFLHSTRGVDIITDNAQTDEYFLYLIQTCKYISSDHSFYYNAHTLFLIEYCITTKPHIFIESRIIEDDSFWYNLGVTSAYLGLNSGFAIYTYLFHPEYSYCNCHYFRNARLCSFGNE